MSWESYQRRASGTNVQQILSEMAESARLKEAERTRAEQVRQQLEAQKTQSDREIQARIMGEYMQHPNQRTFDAMVASGLVPESALPQYTKSLADLADEGGVQDWNADPVNRGLGLGGRATLNYNLASGGHNPNESIAQSNIGTATYEQQDNLPKEVVAQQRVLDKLDLSAQEGEQKRRADRKFLEIERPESTAKISEVGARTTLAGARTKKLGEATSGTKKSPTVALRETQVTAIEKRLTTNYNAAKKLETVVAALDPVAQAGEIRMAKARHKALNSQIDADVAKRDALLRGGPANPAPAPTAPAASPAPVAAKPSLRRVPAPSVSQPPKATAPQLDASAVTRGIAAVRAVHPELTDDQIMQILRDQAARARQ